MSHDPSETVPVPALPGETVLARWDGVEVLQVTGTSPAAAREAAAAVALRAMRDTPFHTPAYTAADTDPDTRVFVAREGGVAVGLAVLRARPRWGWWSWDDYDAERRPSTPVAPMTSWTVESIWTTADHHGKGLATRLLKVASDQVGQRIMSFGWRRPFTPSGEAFVRRHCPEGFWVPD